MEDLNSRISKEIKTGQVMTEIEFDEKCLGEKVNWCLEYISFKKNGDLQMLKS